MRNLIVTIFLAAAMGLSACSQKKVSPAAGVGAEPKGFSVIAAESFLADIAQNVAGDRFQVRSLIPPGLDPHSYDPSPQDVITMTGADLVIINGAGFEAWLEGSIALGELDPARVVEASAGLEPRVVNGETDPHFWLDPSKVIHYVENMEAAFARLDPAGAGEYSARSASYQAKLESLDSNLIQLVETIPQANRIMLTNHESFGYFCDHYGITLAGSILPSPSSEASPSARQMAAQIDEIKARGIRAVFLETGANPNLAEQIVQETGIRVVSTLFTHSLTGEDGPAPTYIDMMEHNVREITRALK